MPAPGGATGRAAMATRARVQCRLRLLRAHLESTQLQPAPARQERSAASTAVSDGVPACHAEDLLDMSVLANFDPQQFAVDGLWIWEGVFTPLGCAKIKEACQRLQRMNDSWNEHDWQQYAWEEMGLARPMPMEREKLIAARALAAVSSAAIGLWR